MGGSAGFAVAAFGKKRAGPRGGMIDRFNEDGVGFFSASENGGLVEAGAADALPLELW